jgi:hypothetical protein
VSDDGVAEARAGAWSSALSLFASSSTLVCCALPALLVALGAGAALSSLVSAVPQLVWLSEHKEGLFVGVAGLLVAAGALHLRNRGSPCPADPALRSVCLRTRRLSSALYLASVGVFAVGAVFAFVVPWVP